MNIQGLVRGPPGDGAGRGRDGVPQDCTGIKGKYREISFNKFTRFIFIAMVY